MTPLPRVGWVVVTVALMLSCAHGLYGYSSTPAGSQKGKDADELSAAERRVILDRAEVWQPIDTAQLDLMRGPAGKGAFAFDTQVTCAFDFPDEPLSGVTPKFDCTIPPGDTVKVKYGADNGEVFAEVAASRLFRALGFNADRMYPVKVLCVNCPADPHKVSTIEWNLGRPGNVSARVFDPATIERKFAGEEIEAGDQKGWSWRELESVADNRVGATRAHIDALKLLAAVVQHVDSKSENQALVCADGEPRRDARGRATCDRPYLVVKDLGSTFAAASKILFPKMKLESWRGVKVWKDEKKCQANLTSSIVGTLEHPRISEQGRKFLAERLSLLSDKQLHDLFTAARVERRKDSVDGRQVTADDWVRAFKAKRAQIVDHRCATT